MTLTLTQTQTLRLRLRLRLRIAKLKKQAFGKSSEKVEPEIPSRDIAAQYPAGQWNSWNWRWKIF
jgi:hypothetical protein